MKYLIVLFLVVSCASNSPKHFTGNPDLVSESDKKIISQALDDFGRDMNYSKEYKKGFRNITITMDYYIVSKTGRGFCRLDKDLSEAELVINKNYWDRHSSYDVRYALIAHGLSSCIGFRLDHNKVYKYFY